MKNPTVVRTALVLIAMILSASLFFGCSQARSDYKSGIYWLEKENNWQMAARSFNRALEKDPKSWKINQKLIQAMGMGEEPKVFESQLRKTLALFPDSARAASLAQPGKDLLGETRYNKVAGGVELMHFGTKLSRDPKDEVLLAKSIMAACRVTDTLAAVDYFKRFIIVADGKSISDSILQELRFFIGHSRLNWITLEAQILSKPDDLDARIAQLNAGILAGDSSGAVGRLSELQKIIPNAIDNQDLAKRYGTLVGYDPFKTKEIARGWDGSESPDGKKLVFIKDMGEEDYTDMYIYQMPSAGGSEKPILKAAQQNLNILAWPRFSPDGKWIYFYGSKDKSWEPGRVGRFNLFRVKPKYNSSPQKLTDSDLIITDPFFDKDGSLLLVRRDVGSVRSSVEIIRVKPDERKIEAVSRIGEPVSSATFNHTGDSLIFATDRGIFRRSVNGGNISVDLPWTNVSFLQISPDGKLLKLCNSSDQLIIVDRDNPVPTFLGTVSSHWVTFGKHGEIYASRYNNKWKRLVRLKYGSPVIKIKDFKQKLKAS
ncbi:MAG: hypothetical protein HN590_10525 [Calditrichaeota bacterium]|nr:hypothetical protein [Calditrichota bacterium]